MRSTLHITAITASSSCNLSLMLSIWERLKEKFQIRGREGEREISGGRERGRVSMKGFTPQFYPQDSN